MSAPTDVTARDDVPRRVGGPPGPLRFAALGDSFTAGVGDPVAQDLRGWAGLLADSLDDGSRGVEFRNYAVSGSLSADVREHQAPAAAVFRPHLAAVVFGTNDTLRHPFDLDRLAHRMDEVCALLAAGGAVLLTACLPDPGAVLGLPATLGRPLARRQQGVNAVVHHLSARYAAVHLHAHDPAWVADRSLWSPDRLHPAERGHRKVAADFHGLLTARGLATGAPPGSEPRLPRPGRAASARLLVTEGAGWLARRSTDLLPQLFLLAAREAGHAALGTTARLDEEHRRTVLAALTALRPVPPRPTPRGTPEDPGQGPRDDLPGADDLAEPGPHHRPAD
ncbi:SGNH/GDSL hydrolase family protein, partial [Streptomyces sp. NPDC002690]